MGVVLGLVLVIGVFVLAAIVSLWWAFWLHPAWGWFMVPLGLPKITLWHFWGIAILFRSKIPEFPNKRPSEERIVTKTEAGAYLVSVVVGPVIVYIVLRLVAAQ